MSELIKIHQAEVDQLKDTIHGAASGEGETNLNESYQGLTNTDGSHLNKAAVGEGNRSLKVLEHTGGELAQTDGHREIVLSGPLQASNENIIGEKTRKIVIDRNGKATETVHKYGLDFKTGNMIVDSKVNKPITAKRLKAADRLIKMAYKLEDIVEQEKAA